MTTRVLALFILILLCPCTYADIVVIVHPSNDSTITPKTIENIYLGKTRKFPNGQKAVPISLLRSADETVAFTEFYLQKTGNQLRSYWARMLFAGEGSPPIEYEDSEAIKKLVASNPEYIGFISADTVDNSVKVVANH